MNKVLAFIMVLLPLAACTNNTSSQQPASQDSVVAHVDETPLSEAAKLFNPLVEKYPNYKTMRLHRKRWRNR
ncbi:MAG: hypothetical protein IJ835_06715 [Muribaculaceae bacterium]|nr:hypothetical protein [Muribaculaceae bacterium]